MLQEFLTTVCGIIPADRYLDIMDTDYGVIINKSAL